MSLVQKIFLLALAPLVLFADAHIFVYHRFDDPKHKSTSTSIEALKEQFIYLKESGYKVIPLKKLVQSINNGSEIDKKWVVLTIDDSYKTFYKNALPLFREFGYPFTLFVYTKAVNDGYGDFMSWEQIRESAKYGEIGNHGHSHSHLTHLSDDEILLDLNLSNSSFLKHLGYQPPYFAYPYGEFDKRVNKIVKRDGFHAILNQTNGSISSTSSIHNLDRIALTGESSIKSKLKIKRLDVEWADMSHSIESGKLDRIYAKISPKYKKAQLYISGHGWRWVDVQDGVIDLRVNIDLTLARTRLFLKADGRQHGILLVKKT